jgi:hypothetical protein
MVRKLLPLLLVAVAPASGSPREQQPPVPAAPPAVALTEIVVDPPEVKLSGPSSRYRLLVHGKTKNGRVVDVTHDARYRSLSPTIASVSATGVIQGLADGTATVNVEVHGMRRTVSVRVLDSGKPRAFHFESDIVPLFSRFGCNSSGCHGGAQGQNGFKLSVFGFDPAADHAALIKEARGRRVLPTAPEHSLLLLKASGTIAHGGGIRISQGSLEYETIRGWIAAGAPMGDPKAPHVTAIRVEPSERQLGMNAQQQLRVLASYSNGREADVTAHAKFQSNNDGLASVSADGLVYAGRAAGEVAIMASFMGSVATFRAIVPRPEKIANHPQTPENNFIDGLVSQKLKKLNIIPSALCDDAEYLRRAYLDVIGTLPTSTEARRFLADKQPDRRALLVHELLQRPEFADYWALQWADMLRVDRQALGHKGAYGFYRWIRDSLAANKPLDQFAREVVTAEGALDENGPAHFYKVVTRPGDRASTLVQVFLGLRIACAECHHHPFDRWSQTDYYGMEAFFTPVNLRPSGRGELLVTAAAPPTKHPRTGETVLAHLLGAKVETGSKSKDSETRDPRADLANWLTAASNPWFARNIANRTWAHFLGRGLVEPVDDVRDTNPPSNPQLLDALARHLIDSKYDLKQLIRVIIASRTYQLSSRPNVTNEQDELNFSRALFRRIDAEVLLDMVSQATGIEERFQGMPAGYRAIQLWDSKVPHYFLKLFGRPARVSACECERNHEPGVSQVLHLLNSPHIQGKLSHERGNVVKLVKSQKEDAGLVDELYLTFFSRFPTPAERQTGIDFLRRHATDRRQAAEDLAWSLLNSLEFVFNH